MLFLGNKAIPFPLLLFIFASITGVYCQKPTSSFDDDQVVCGVLGCTDCVQAPYCYWCNGEVFLSSGSMIWGYCMMAKQSNVRTCELDGGYTFIGNDTTTCNKTLSGNDSSVKNTNDHPSECPYNGCSMCTKVENCRWCKLGDFDLWSCMGQHEVAQFGTDCKDTCVDPNENPCQSSTCSSCTKQSSCSWCGGQYTSLDGRTNYTWGFCLLENSSSQCQLEEGEGLLQCDSQSLQNTTNSPINPDENPSSIDRMSDPYEDSCTAFSTCSTCMTHSWCGWCSSPAKDGSLPWGECRGIFQTKNGEYGKQFCMREKGFWREINCVPDQLEVAVVLTQLSVSDYQNWLFVISNVTQFENNFLIGFDNSNTTFLIKLIAVQVNFNKSTNDISVLFFQRVVQPLVPITHDLLVLQCEEMVSALWGLVPKYLYNRIISCQGLVLQSNRFISEITIEGVNTTDLSNSASRVLNWLFFWPVLLVLLT